MDLEIKVLISHAKSEVLNDTLDLAHINYCVLDPEGNFIARNKTIEENFDKKLTNFKDIDAVAWADCVTVMQSGQSAIKAEQYRDKYFISVKKPLIEQGECKGILIFSFDITPQKQAEITKKLFIDSMEHDLKTPFAGIINVADYLLTHQDITAEERLEMLGYIKTSGNRVFNMFEQIIDVIKLDEPRVMTTFHTQAILKSMQELFVAKLHEKQLTLTNASVNDYEITTDKTAIESILLNLVGNAVKFTKEGGVTMTCDVVNQQLIMTVKDTGIGIDAKNHAMIFEKFTKIIPTFQLSGHHGMGKGLFLVKSYTEHLGGTVTLDSTVGVGSTFTVTIPLDKNKIN